MRTERLLAWCLLWFLGSFFSYWLQLTESQADYDAGDRSAFAWHGFLPFLIPIFMAHSALIVGPIALLVEFVLWLRRRKGV